MNFRGENKMKKIHNVQKLTFVNGQMRIKVNGKEYIIPLSKVSKKLLNASRAEKENYEISPAGYGIHWPAIDEDLSVDALLGIKHKSSIETFSSR